MGNRSEGCLSDGECPLRFLDNSSISSFGLLDVDADLVVSSVMRQGGCPSEAAVGAELDVVDVGTRSSHNLVGGIVDEVLGQGDGVVHRVTLGLVTLTYGHNGIGRCIVVRLGRITHVVSAGSEVDIGVGHWSVVAVGALTELHCGVETNNLAIVGHRIAGVLTRDNGLILTCVLDGVFPIGAFDNQRFVGGIFGNLELDTVGVGIHGLGGGPRGAVVGAIGYGALVCIGTTDGHRLS